MTRSILLSLAALLPGLVSAGLIDTLVFGNDASEPAHETTAPFSDFQTGDLIRSR